MIGDESVSPDEERRMHAVWNQATILRRLEAVLDPTEFHYLLERLSRTSPDDDSDQESAWLGHVVAAATTLPLQALPSELSIRLRTMFPPRPAMRHFEAVLTNDSRIERELVGVRGAADRDGWPYQ